MTKSKTKKEESVEVPFEEKNSDLCQEEVQTELKLTTEIEDLNKELEEAKEKYLRIYSDFENFRRRTSKEKISLIYTANREVLENLLPVLDDFERAMLSVKEVKGKNDFVEGVQFIQNKLFSTLESKGLSKMEVKKGDVFDDKLHEAVTQIPSEEKMEGKIVDIINPGYQLADTVLRYAKVVVGTKK